MIHYRELTVIVYRTHRAAQWQELCPAV